MVEKKPIDITQIRAIRIVEKFKEPEKGKQLMKRTPIRMESFYMSPAQMFVESERLLSRRRKYYPREYYPTLSSLLNRPVPRISSRKKYYW